MRAASFDNSTRLGIRKPRKGNVNKAPPFTQITQRRRTSRFLGTESATASRVNLPALFKPPFVSSNRPISASLRVKDKNAGKLPTRESTSQRSRMDVKARSQKVALSK